MTSRVALAVLAACAIACSSSGSSPTPSDVPVDLIGDSVWHVDVTFDSGARAALAYAIAFRNVGNVACIARSAVDTGCLAPPAGASGGWMQSEKYVSFYFMDKDRTVYFSASGNIDGTSSDNPHMATSMGGDGTYEQLAVHWRATRTK